MGLAITKQSYNPETKVTHYTVTPAHDMPLKKFLRLLGGLKSVAKRAYIIGSP
jgi:hypothetical protein